MTTKSTSQNTSNANQQKSANQIKPGDSHKQPLKAGHQDHKNTLSERSNSSVSPGKEKS